ncbi:MAG: prephenate dehydratase [Holosporales bacterium]|jgi:prephenate dehydratase
MTTPLSSSFIVAFQGIAGAYSHQVCRVLFPEAEVLPCFSFEDAFNAVREGRASHAVLPVENNTAGRVADMHTLLPQGGLFITAEHYEPIVHHLLSVPGATLDSIKDVHSHIQALTQCRSFLRQHQLTPVVHSDTAGAARDVAYWKNPRNAAIASHAAGEIYGLVPLAKNIADIADNVTRFLVLEPALRMPMYEDTGAYKTTLFFILRDVPAALYKALGGFATNGINLSKIESYLRGGRFAAAAFIVDANAHKESMGFQQALEELHFYSEDIRILGVYPQGQLY